MYFTAFVSLLFMVADSNFNAPYEYNNNRREIRKELSRKIKHGRATRRVALILLLLGCLSLLPDVNYTRAFASPITWLVLTLLLIIWLHVLFSSDIRLSIRRSLSFSVVIVSGYLVGATRTLTDLAILAGACCLSLLLIGIFNELVQGTLFKRTKYRFGGTLHPNQQGINSAILVLVSTWAATNKVVPIVVWFPSLFLAAMALIFTRSRSAFWVCVVGVAFELLLPNTNFPVDVRFFLALGFLLLAVVFYVLYIDMGNKSLTALLVDNKIFRLGRYSIEPLSGRYHNWRFVRENFNPLSFKGTGLGCFWSEERREKIQQNTGWRFADCHSTYLDLWTQLGLSGLVTFVALAVASMVVCTSPPASLSSSIVLVTLLFGLMESTFATANLSSFIFFMIIGNTVTI